MSRSSDNRDTKKNQASLLITSNDELYEVNSSDEQFLPQFQRSKLLTSQSRHSINETESDSQAGADRINIESFKRDDVKKSFSSNNTKGETSN